VSQGLLIAGSPIRVIKDSWVQAPSILQGSRMRMADGGAVDMTYAEVRVWDCQAYFTTLAEVAAARALMPPGVAVTISGELPEGPVDVLIDIGATPKMRKFVSGAYTVHWRMALHIEEQAPA
jgi:hypothetical protein